METLGHGMKRFLIRMALITGANGCTLTCKPYSVHVCCALKQRTVTILPVSWPLCVFVMILENSIPLMETRIGVQL